MKRNEHPLRSIWNGMINRCYNATSDRYRFYGAKGVTVCLRWRRFENFLADMGDRPFPKATIERIDGTKGYCPENCRWATMKEQNRNRIDNHILTIGGRSQCLMAWAEESGTPRARIWARKRLGWSDKDAVFAPKVERVLEYRGTKKPLQTWAKIVGLKPGTLWYRLSVGWPVADALTTPTQKL